MGGDTWDVVIVGGGFAGVNCAAQLESLLPPTARILLLEASDRLGGRARSFTPRGLDCALDLGAHFLGKDHVRAMGLARRLLRDDEIYSHVDGYGPDPAARTLLEGKWRVTTKKSSFFELQGLNRRVAWDHKVRIFESLLRYLQVEAGVSVSEPWRSVGAVSLDAMTFADWVALQRVPTWIREMWGLAVLDIISIRPEQISMLYWLWYSAANGGFLQMANDHRGGPQEFGLTVGLGGLLSRFAESLRCSIRTDCPVESVFHDSADLVRLGLADGSSVAARHVVIAATPHAVGKTIEFTPALSQPRQLLHAQPVAHAVKAVCVYDERWWQGNDLDYLTWTSGASATGVEWALDTSDPAGRQYSLSAFVSPVLIDSAGDEVEKAVREAMVEMCGDPRAGSPTHLEVWDWRDHPWVLGGPNTSFGTGVLTAVADVWNKPEPPHHRLRFASSEYSPQYPGYVEGAMAAGELAAGQVAGDLRAECGWSGAALPSVQGLRAARPVVAAGYRGLRALTGPATFAASVARSRRGGERTL
jgi:monoamine oxidase